MSNPAPPTSAKETFNQKIYGFFGKFGTGAKAQISFIQGGIKPIDLHRVTLISNIPNSEKWPVRDLFQRDVDVDRVTNGLIPYFKDKDKVKFFNPLTLTLLPVDPDSHQIVTKIPAYKEYEEVDQNKNVWICYEAEGTYRFKHVKNSEQYGVIEWNDSLVKVVAIDGQHRLSALKRYNDDTKDDMDFNTWTIPVVLFGLNNLSDSNRKDYTILSFIRNIFIYINTQAKPPNITRQILLSDERVNDICVQELLDHFHANDLLEDSQKDITKMPLLFFDWRGEEKDGIEQHSPGAIKSIVEIRDWFEEYILGENFSGKQKISLGIQPVTEVLHEAFTLKKMGPREAREIKRVFKNDVMPGICYFLENFSPYENYISQIRQIEQRYQNQTDIARHSFYQLRFGVNRANNDLKKQVDELFHEILGDITTFVISVDFKSKFKLLNRDIGMRGIMFAYGELTQIYANWVSRQIDWLEFSKWFTIQINSILDDGWLSGKELDQESLLLHVSQDQNETIVNYRLGDVPNALGAFILILIVAYASSKTDTAPSKQSEWISIWDQYSDFLGATILKGYKKQVRALLRDDFPNDPIGLKKAVEVAAKERVEDHLNRFEQKILELTGLSTDLN